MTKTQTTAKKRPTLTVKKVPCDKVATEKALVGIYKNATMSKHAIKSLLSYVEDKEFAETLLAETAKYDEFCQKAEKLADELKLKITPVSKTVLWMAKVGMRMKMMSDKSTSNAAKIMLNGTFMGVIDLTTLFNHTEHLGEKVSALAQDLLAYQDERIKKLRTVL